MLECFHRDVQKWLRDLRSHNSTYRKWISLWFIRYLMMEYVLQTLQYSLNRIIIGTGFERISSQFFDSFILI